MTKPKIVNSDSQLRLRSGHSLFSSVMSISHPRGMTEVFSRLHPGSFHYDQFWDAINLRQIAEKDNLFIFSYVGRIYVKYFCSHCWGAERRVLCAKTHNRGHPPSRICLDTLTNLKTLSFHQYSLFSSWPPSLRGDVINTWQLCSFFFLSIIYWTNHQKAVHYSADKSIF
jgi:hypothetical protein